MARHVTWSWLTVGEGPCRHRFRLSPRLKDSNVLIGAIQDGLAMLPGSTVLVRPDVPRVQLDAERQTAPASGDEGAAATAGGLDLADMGDPSIAASGCPAGSMAEWAWTPFG
jgi:hypothetical protein